MPKSKKLLQRLTTSEKGIRLGLWLSQTLPTGLGHRLSRYAADFLSKQKDNAIVEGMRVNQWVAHDGKLTEEELHQAVQAALRINTRCLFDFYHNLKKPERVVQLVEFSPLMEEVFQKLLRREYAAMIVAPHTSNFDMAGRALNLRGLRFQVLSYPQPPSGYELQNRLREEAGMEVTPMSMLAFQQARQRLSGGGVVLTGVDRAIDKGKLQPMFFGRPSNLPVAYMQLALHAKVPVHLVHVETIGKRYRLNCEPGFVPQPYADRDEALVRNTEVLLRRVEEVIRAKPEDWSMTYPAWDDVLDELPH